VILDIRDPHLNNGSIPKNPGIKNEEEVVMPTNGKMNEIQGPRLARRWIILMRNEIRGKLVDTYKELYGEGFYF
jgi:hypothetical protein